MSCGYLESFDPLLSERCDCCYGRKTIEVCGTCKQMPEVKGGLEVCGCGWSCGESHTLA